MLRKLFIFCNNFSIAFNKKNISDYAASAAFFLFLSMIPLLMLTFTVLPISTVEESEMLSLVLRYTPDTMDSFVAGLINEIYDISAGMVTISIVITLWSAGKGMQSLIRGLNAINEIVENRGFLVLRVLACIYTVIMLIATTIMMVLLMFGREVFYFIAAHIPAILSIKHLILYFRYPVSWIVLVILFTTIYCFVPRKKQRFKAQLPGAVFSAIIWSLASWVFSTYLKYYDGFSAYGSMATVIIVMVYMYMMMYILLVGAYINMWLGRSETNADQY